MNASALMFLALLALMTTGTCIATENDNRHDAGTVHERCRLLRVGMNYRDAMAILQREPDSTLSGHTAAEPWEGGKPPGSYGIDFWQDALPGGGRLVTQLRYSGGQVESFDCGMRQDPQPDQGASLPDDGH